MILRNFFQALGDLVFPRACCVCGRQLLLCESNICTVCLTDLPETHFCGLLRNPMADRLNEAIEKRRGDEYEPYSAAAALFYYNEESGYDNITKEIKYHRNFSTGKMFGSLLGQRLAESPLYQDVDAVVPVPLHPLRRWSRGYNQAEVIARAVAAELPGKPRVEALLKRCRRTRSQTRLEWEDKASNVSGAFSLRCGVGKYRHLLLVDDVFTSGSTVAECHRVLRAHYGPEVNISVATLAYVEH